MNAVNEFDLMRVGDPAEIALRMTSGIVDARAWLNNLRNMEGILDVFSANPLAAWPSFKLSYALSSRFFVVGETPVGMTILAARGRTPTGESLMKDPLAWFPLIPWDVEYIQRRGLSEIRLTCTEMKTGDFSSNQWSLTLRHQYKLNEKLRKAERFALWNDDGRFNLGWETQ